MNRVERARRNAEIAKRSRPVAAALTDTLERGMRTPRTALVVGNGLTLSLRAHAHPMLDAWNPSEPLKWCAASGQPLLQHFPRFADALGDTLSTDTDFARLQQVAAKAARTPNFVATELRHFLALAYSVFDTRVAAVPRRDLLSWGWSKYFDVIRDGLEIVVSFNYDLVLERVFDELRIPFRRFGLTDERHGVPILKPHGSIDFESARSLGLTPTWPITIETDLVDAPLMRLSAPDREQARCHPELVPPNEASRIANFQWVAPGFEKFRARADALDQIILLGHSYADVDRPEIDRLLSYVTTQSRVVIANRTPPEDLVVRARELGHDVALWCPGPDLTDVGRPVLNLGYLNRRRRATPGRLDAEPPPVPTPAGPTAMAIEGSNVSLENVGISGFAKAFEGTPRRLSLKDVTINPRADG
jgi:hypothetical protein